MTSIRIRWFLALFVVQSIVWTGVAHADGPAVEAVVPSEAKPWTSLTLNNDPSVFRFAVVSDNAGGPRAGIYREAIDKLNLLQPEFVITTGDLIEGYEDTAEQLNAQWDRFLGELGRLKMPFFFVPGNHDHGRPLWSEVYNARFGVPYYHFLYKNVLFLCLDTNDSPDRGTGIGDEQVEYAARVLREHKDVRWTLVFQHKPLWNDKGSQGWAKIEELLKDRKCTVFAGHTHNYLSQEIHGNSFITLATTGGGTALRGPAYGEFDHIAWVTMTNNGPQVANLRLEGILDKNVRTPESAESLKLFRAGRAVSATPIVLEAGPFQSGVSKLKIVNAAQEPMRIKVLSETPAGVRVEPGTVAQVLPANGEQIVELRVTSDQPVPLSEVQPIVLHWTASYDSTDNTPSVELAGECRVAIESPMALPVCEKPPVIDGKLDDWKELPFVVNQPGQVFMNIPGWKGPQDGSYRFGVSRDDQNLYVAVKTHDDELCFDGWKYWEDFAIVFLDARGSSNDDPKTAIFSASMGPGVTREQTEEFATGIAPEGIRSASLPGGDGFEAEMAIPLSYVNDRQGGDWKRLRLNVAFSDFDRHDARDGVTILYWRPDWTRPGASPESGLFLRTPEEGPTAEGK